MKALRDASLPMLNPVASIKLSRSAPATPVVMDALLTRCNTAFRVCKTGLGIVGSDME